MNGFEVYKIYCGLKSHFTLGNAYDFVKYRGATRVSLKSYNNRHDQKYFEWLASKYDSNLITPFLISNFIVNENSWIGEMTNDFNRSEEIFVEWRRRYETMTQVFTDDIKNIRSSIDDKGLKFIDLFDVTKQKHPAIFRFLLYGMISLETFIILNDIQNFYTLFDKKFSDDPLWVQWKFRCEKYRSFLNIDKKKYSKILKENFS